MLMKRDDYKAVKRMDRAQMSDYLQKVYRRGYDAGFKAATARPVTKDGIEEDAAQSAAAPATN